MYLSGFKLAIGFSEVDIAIYRKNPFNKRDQKVLKFFKFLQDSKKDEEFINIPFIILELKSGEITSDAIRARNEVARKIRNIFPFCAYFFIGDKTSKRRETLFGLPGVMLVIEVMPELTTKLIKSFTTSNCNVKFGILSVGTNPVFGNPRDEGRLTFILFAFLYSLFSENRIYSLNSIGGYKVKVGTSGWSVEKLFIIYLKFSSSWDFSFVNFPINSGEGAFLPAFLF